MIFPLILFIATICLWWLFGEVALLGEALLTIGMFALALSVHIWTMLEAVELTMGSSRAGTETDTK